jgi:hypothetical protein
MNHVIAEMNQTIADLVAADFTHDQIVGSLQSEFFYDVEQLDGGWIRVIDPSSNVAATYYV